MRMSSGRLLVTVLFVLSFVPAGVVNAQTVTLYDRFTDKRIDTAKWVASNSNNAFRLEEFRKIVGGSLILRHRSYADEEKENGLLRARLGLRMTDGNAAAVNRMSARVRVDTASLRDCLGSREVSKGGIRLEGYWLNDGSGSEATGDRGTIWAAIRVARLNPGAASVARITARVFRCGNQDCSEGVGLLDKNFANVRLRNWINIEISHERSQSKIVFLAGRKRATWDYGAAGITAAAIPGAHFKALRNISDVTNCGTDPRFSFADVRSRIDWVRVGR